MDPNSMADFSAGFIEFHMSAQSPLKYKHFFALAEYWPQNFSRTNDYRKQTGKSKVLEQC